MLSDVNQGPGDAGPDSGPATGRHALDEDALFTPIFHALTRDDIPVVREPMRAVEDVDRFRRDPLTAPIPIPVLDEVWPPEPAQAPRRRTHDGPGRRTAGTGEAARRRGPVHGRRRSEPTRRDPRGYPATLIDSSFRWDGQEWHGPDVRPHRAPADPAVNALTDTGRHHLYQGAAAAGW